MPKTEKVNLEIKLVSGFLREHGISENLIKKVAHELAEKEKAEELVVKEFIKTKLP